MEYVERNPWADEGRLLVTETTKPRDRTSYLYTSEARQLHNAACGKPPHGPIIVVSEMRFNIRKSRKHRKPRRQPERWNYLGMRPICCQRHHKYK